jgi:streptogramin lyase
VTAHRRFLKLSAVAIDFGLSPAEQLDLDGHLATCSECRAAAIAFRLDAEGLRDRPRSRPPDGMRERVSVEWAGNRRRSPRASTDLLLVAAAIALVAIGGALLGGGGIIRPSPAPTSLTPPASIGPAPAQVLPIIGSVRAASVPSGPAAHEHSCHVIVESGCTASIVATSDAIWTTTSSGLARLDPGSGGTVQTIAAGTFPQRLAVAADGSIWAIESSPPRAVRIDPGTATAEVSHALTEVPSAIAADAAGVWVVQPNAGRIDRLDGASGKRLGSVEVGPEPWSIAADRDSLWVVDRRGRTIWQVDPATATVADTIDLTMVRGTFDADPVGTVVAAFDRLWIPSHDSILVFEPASGAVAVRTTLTFPTIAAGGGSVWMVGHWNRVLDRVDPTTQDVVARQNLNVSDEWQWDLPAVVGPDGTLWIRDYGNDQVLGITPS